MKAVFEFDFKTAEAAKKAEKLLEREELDGRSKVVLKTRGKIVEATATAERFALLRARATALMRNAKIVYDSFELVGKKQEE